ncbi:MAG TPA: mannose-1-phosphate guanylyltransferase [Phycisphaerales bacterium]|nr:mannose-1-phosphate guanylyltransferase [Phycisphaerales bacterium]
MDYAMIMAGGTGKRLWPLSRQNRPKQVLRLVDGQTLLRRCFDRLRDVFDPDHLLVLTNAAYVETVRGELPEVPAPYVVAEPAVRDTAPAIGLAATILAKGDPEATVAVVTADQVIEPVETFESVLRDALTFVNHHPEAIVTFGIEPTFPSTQLGYIELGAARQEPGCRSTVHPVECFREKPDEATAQQYVASGRFCWNAGMFVFRARTMLDHLARLLPDSTEPLARIREAWGTPDQQVVLEAWFVRLPKISIDFAVMEKAPHVYAIRLPCRWLDLGAFRSLAEIIGRDENGNVPAAACHELLDSEDNILVSEDNGHLIALIGVRGLVVAHSPDATLVCSIAQAERLKELLENVARHHGGRFL